MKQERIILIPLTIVERPTRGCAMQRTNAHKTYAADGTRPFAQGGGRGSGQKRCKVGSQCLNQRYRFSGRYAAALLADMPWLARGPRMRLFEKVEDAMSGSRCKPP